MIESIVVFLWLLIGISGFIYFETEENDLTLGILFLGLLLVSWFGPITWLTGYMLCNRPIVIMKRRR